nr:MAG: hypothetical protein [Microvirus sp.]
MDIYDHNLHDFVKIDTVVSGSNLAYSVLLHTGRRTYSVVGWFEKESDALSWIARQSKAHPGYRFSVHCSLF